MAAGSLIVTEAGGEVVDPTGRPFNMMCRRARVNDRCRSQIP